jgi:hypothetical protein
MQQGAPYRPRPGDWLQSHPGSSIRPQRLLRPLAKPHDSFPAQRLCWLQRQPVSGLQQPGPAAWLLRSTDDVLSGHFPRPHT